MTRFRSTTKRSVMRRDGAACRYCGRRVFTDVEETHSQRLTMDHLWPDSEDGSNGMHNLVVSCRKCNRRKASNSPTGEWMPLLPPVEPPELLPYVVAGHQAEPIVPLDRGRVLVPYVSRFQIVEMNEGTSWKSDEMYRLRGHMLPPFGPSVDDETTP